MRAEIWIGGMTSPAYIIYEVEHVFTIENGALLKIVDEDGNIYTTSPHNVVVVKEAEIECKTDYSIEDGIPF